MLRTILNYRAYEVVKPLRLPSKYWENKENIIRFLADVKEKYHLNTIDDWNSITQEHITDHGGGTLLNKYSIFELKCMACPEGKLSFKKTKQAPGYWENQENIHQFLLKIKEKYNINTPNKWNLITKKLIVSNGGSTLIKKYPIYELKCMACPEGKLLFSNPPLKSGYWENEENILHFLSKIKEKYNLHTIEDWNSITREHIQSNGGSRLLSNYSLFELKCMACPEGKLSFKKTKQAPGYWENQENVHQFLSKIREKYNLKTSDDWNSITHKLIRSNGGRRLLSKYSIYELKCMAFPEGELIFNNSPQVAGYWENEDNVHQFLSKIQEKYNLHTPEDWNSITAAHIQSNGGSRLLSKYSIYELKSMACPEGNFSNPNQVSGYWGNKENILQFLSKIKEKYNLNTPEEWNIISNKHIQANGGGTLLSKYSLYELKCMACPEGKSSFDNPPLSPGYWENKENIHNFLSKIHQKYNLNTPEDWKRISKHQITSEGGWGLFNSKIYSEIKIKFETSNGSEELISFSKLISSSGHKRSSQRWLFLQVQKLFPQEEIVEDYFHSEISRTSGFNVQFDIFMIHKNIAIEYHGKQHYEDIPRVFSNVETYKNRDIEKERICSERGIQLIVIPYWWDNKLDSLRTFLYSKINL